MLTFQIKNNLKIDKVSSILKLMMLMKNKDYNCSPVRLITLNFGWYMIAYQLPFAIVRVDSELLNASSKVASSRPRADERQLYRFFRFRAKRVRHKGEPTKWPRDPKSGNRWREGTQYTADWENKRWFFVLRPGLVYLEGLGLTYKKPSGALALKRN